MSDRRSSVVLRSVAEQNGVSTMVLSEKKATAEGREGVSNRALASNFETPILATSYIFLSPRATGQRRSREPGAGLGLEVAECAPSGELEPQPRKR